MSQREHFFVPGGLQEMVWSAFVDRWRLFFCSYSGELACTEFAFICSALHMLGILEIFFVDCEEKGIESAFGVCMRFFTQTADDIVSSIWEVCLDIVDDIGKCLHFPNVCGIEGVILIFDGCEQSQLLPKFQKEGSLWSILFDDRFS